MEAKMKKDREKEAKRLRGDIFIFLWYRKVL